MIDHHDALLARARGGVRDGHGAAERVRPRSVRRPQHRHRRLDRRHRLLPRRRRGGGPGLEHAPAGSVRRTPTVLGVGGAAIPAWETAAPAWWPNEFGWVVGCSYRGQPTHDVAGTQPDGLQHVAASHGPGRRSVASTPGWVATATTSSAARRPSSASGPDSCFPTASSCTSRQPSCTTTSRAGGRPGATSATAAAPRASPRPAWPAGWVARPRCPARPTTSGGCCRPGC